MSIHPKTKPPVTLEEVYLALLRISESRSWLGSKLFPGRIEFKWDKFIEVFDREKWNV